MREFELYTEMELPRPREEVFAFFADAGNLERITPPSLRFRILPPKPIRMGRSTLIDYSLRLRGIPLLWRSEITAWEPPCRFVDEQRRGPYRFWHHEHRFEAIAPGRTKVIDQIRYAVFGGELIRNLFVAKELERIFRYRQETIARLLGGGEAAGAEGGKMKSLR